MSIPVVMVWRLHLPLRKKLMLFGVFSLTVFTMITALVRLLVVPQGMISTDLTWSFTWSNIEMSTSMLCLLSSPRLWSVLPRTHVLKGIVVACLGSFRQLYTNHQNRQSKYPLTSSNKSSSFRFWKSSKSRTTDIYGHKYSTPDSSQHLNSRDIVLDVDTGDEFSLPLQSTSQLHSVVVQAPEPAKRAPR
jgi:hypothetical protein